MKLRATMPRSLQTLFSWYRYDRSESIRKYPRKLKYVNNPSYQLCNHLEESIDHLLTSFSGTLKCQNKYDLSLQTFVEDSLSSILKIAEFDIWIH